MSFKSNFTILIALFFASCGIEYTPISTPETLTEARREAIQSYLKTTLENDTTVYSTIAFGKSKTIKPISYRQLDSLYGVKYDLEKQNKIDRNLENEIQIQRQIALNDTTGIRYIEDHLFSLRMNKKLEVYSSQLTTNGEHKITQFEITETSNIPAKDLELFKIYTFEESFLLPGYAPIGDEINFYRRYKEQSTFLNGSLKDSFLVSTLGIMRAASRIQSLKTSALLSELTRNEIHHTARNGVKDEQFEVMQENYMTIDGKEVLSGYFVVYSFKRILNEMTTSYRYALTFSPFLEIVKFGLY